MIKKIILRILFVLLNFGIIAGMWYIGYRAIIGFCAGILVGACVVLYWEYSRNSWLSTILNECMREPPQKKKVRGLEDEEAFDNKRSK